MIGDYEGGSYIHRLWIQGKRYVRVCEWPIDATNVLFRGEEVDLWHRVKHWQDLVHEGQLPVHRRLRAGKFRQPNRLAVAMVQKFDVFNCKHVECTVLMQ